MNRIQNELYSLVTGEYIEGKTELDLLSKKAFAHMLRKKAKRLIRENGYPPLTRQELRQIKEYYRGYPAISPIYHRVCKGKNGRFYTEYIPEELYYGYIEPYFSGRVDSRYVDNKCDYYRMFAGMKQPELICMRSRGLWMNDRLEPIAKKDVPECLKTDGELVLKIAENSEGGAGVYFLAEEDRIETFKKLMKDIKNDVVIQRCLKQHEDYSVLHPESVNTLRIMSLLEPDGVHILGTCLRVGVGTSRIDNSSSGGFFVGVSEDGRLGDVAVYDSGERLTRHPDLGYVISEQSIPYVDRAHAFIKKAHPYISRFRLVAWDIALDEEGEPNLIEVNLTLGAIDDIQACCGPLFGRCTKRVLKEVFGR